MEEKERYELTGYYSYRDRETGVIDYNFVRVLNEQDKKIKDLEAKLSEMQNEKDELISKYRYWRGECAELKEQLAEEKNRNKKLNYEAQKYYEDAYCNGFQNQTAITELEKVKEYNRGLVYSSSLIDKFIDNQIKSLKGENK